MSISIFNQEHNTSHYVRKLLEHCKLSPSNTHSLLNAHQSTNTQSLNTGTGAHPSQSQSHASQSQSQSTSTAPVVSLGVDVKVAEKALQRLVKQLKQTKPATATTKVVKVSSSKRKASPPPPPPPPADALVGQQALDELESALRNRSHNTQCILLPRCAHCDRVLEHTSFLPVPHSPTLFRLFLCFF